MPLETAHNSNTKRGKETKEKEKKTKTVILNAQASGTLSAVHLHLNHYTPNQGITSVLHTDDFRLRYNRRKKGRRQGK